MKQPLFSVIVPVYNVEKYLGQCLDSIINQTFRDFEVILVDDGSKDSSGDICNRYEKNDSRIKVIHRENGGLVEARKTGVAHATGQYVACVDSDDWVDTDYLENFAKPIKKYNADIICCGYINETKDKQIPITVNAPSGFYNEARIKEVIYPFLIEDKKSRYFRPSIWAKAMRTNIYKQQQQVSGLVSVGEDHACTKPCIYHSKSMYVLSKCMYHYRNNPVSMTKKKKAFYWGGPKAIGQHMKCHIDMDKYDFNEQMYRNVTHNVFNVALSQFNENNSYKQNKQKILEEISDPYYQRAIKNCSFARLSAGNMAKILLTRQWVFAMWIIYRIR